MRALITGKPVLYCTCFGILFGTLGIVWLQIQFLVENHHLNFIPGEITLEENIAIVIAAFGVFLDLRRWVVRSFYADGVPEEEEARSAFCQKRGVQFILLGILIEIVDLCFLALTNFGLDMPILLYGEFLVLLVLNLVAIVSLLIFAIELK